MYPRKAVHILNLQKLALFGKDWVQAFGGVPLKDLKVTVVHLLLAILLHKSCLRNWNKSEFGGLLMLQGALPWKLPGTNSFAICVILFTWPSTTCGSLYARTLKAKLHQGSLHLNLNRWQEMLRCMRLMPKPPCWVF